MLYSDSDLRTVEKYVKYLSYQVGYFVDIFSLLLFVVPLFFRFCLFMQTITLRSCHSIPSSPVREIFKILWRMRSSPAVFIFNTCVEFRGTVTARNVEHISPLFGLKFLGKLTLLKNSLQRLYFSFTIPLHSLFHLGNIYLFLTKVLLDHISFSL